jgi:hypothetical protein
MIIRNPLWLKRPWLLPLLTLYTLFAPLLLMWRYTPDGLNTEVVLIIVGANLAINVWYFASLRQTRRKIQLEGSVGSMPIPKMKALAALLIICGIAVPLIEFGQFMFGDKTANMTSGIGSSIIGLALGLKLWNKAKQDEAKNGSIPK